MKVVYTEAWVLLAYALSAVLLSLGMISGGWLWFGVGVAFFVLWDLGWLLVDREARDRSAAEMVNSASRARTYMSWFLGIYGAVLAFFLFQATEDARNSFFVLCAAANINPLIFVLPFALTGLALLFFPIALGKGDGTDLSTKHPSIANISVVILTAWIQKVTTFAFLYGVLRLLYHVWQHSFSYMNDTV
jgi:hypothetical protein